MKHSVQIILSKIKVRRIEKEKNMSHTIDGLSFDMPPTENQIIALAHHHRKLLDEAVFHQEIHLGDYCLAQRKRVYDFAINLSPQDKDRFYEIYNGELLRIADEDDLHPADAESGVGMFAIFITLLIIAFILYFAFVRTLTS
ncbi:hypothetical protein HMP0015_2072 [Acinetobacter haemolyticus ATCC 19194]|uniref:Uncharacterized protein n=2 Tax=Acinetobacter haemolyticus TaxID=29430 RepID=D4XQT0_ACIHA|nr:hypothetical protein HMP0015_2072 [Acinetobacter haemolyticus ATCC 19194]